MATYNNVPESSAQQQLRSQGNTLQYYQDRLRIRQNTIQELQKEIGRRETLGKNTVAQKARLVELQSRQDAYRQEYEQFRAGLPDEGAAYRAAPKEYHTGGGLGEFHPGEGSSGILYSQPGSLTGGGQVTPTGTKTGGDLSAFQRASGASLSPGVYRGGKGEQVIVQQGRGAQNAGQLIRNLQGRPYTPAPLPYQPGKIVGLVKGNTLDLGPQRLSITDNLGNAIAKDIKNIPLSVINANGRSVGNNRGISRSDFGFSLGTDFLSQASKKGQKLPNYFYASPETIRLFNVGSAQQSGKLPAFVTDTKTGLGLTAHPIDDISYFYTKVRNRVFVQNPYIKNVENFFRNVGESNERFLNTNIPKLPFNAYGKSEIGGAANLFLVAPSRLIAGSIKTTRETPETIPLAYGVGKLFGLGVEGSQYLAGRAATTTASDPFLVRTSIQGLNKGLQLAPYGVGAAFLGQQGVEASRIPGYGNRSEYIGQQLPGLVAFGAGDISVRGKATQGILKGYTWFTGARELPASRIAEQSVIDYYTKPTIPGRRIGQSLRGDYYEMIPNPNIQKFSIIKPAGNLQANLEAFETATYLRPTYTTKIFKIPTALTEVSPFKIPSNPDITVSLPKGANKQYDVITATQAMFSRSTTAGRGTSAQAGIYVSPTGQTQLFFLGLGKSADYDVSFGLGIPEPNLVRVKNIKSYSEELIPIFKQEGQGNRQLSDEYLRIFSEPKTVYMESRTFFGETPEVQAVIPEGTPLVQRNLRGSLQKFFGFREFIKLDIADRGSTIIPVRSYTAGRIKVIPPAPGTTGVTGFFKGLYDSRRGSALGGGGKSRSPFDLDIVRDLNRQSTEYFRYQRRIDPARLFSGSRSSKGISNVLYMTSSRSSSKASQSIFPSSFSYSQEPYRYSQSYEPSKISKSSLSRSISGSVSSLASSIERSTSGSSIGRSTGSSTGYSRGGLPFVPPPYYPFPEYQQGRQKKKKQKKARSVFEEFFYTPTIAGLLQPASRQQFRPITTGLRPRPVQYNRRLRSILDLFGG